MEPGHETNASASSFTPSAKYLSAALVTGVLLVVGAVHDGQPPQPPTGQSFTPGGPTSSGTSSADRPAVQPLPSADPVSLRIPAIRVHAPVAELDLDERGALQPPPDNPNLVGWYSGGTAPGSAGTAVIAGHVDLPTGSRGVFYDLGALTRGNRIEVRRSDGRTAVFTVDAVEVHDKDRFPSEKVYGSSDVPELRVITCGGGYVRNDGYQANVVVYATLAGVGQPADASLSG
ncbi:class F sortase [Streptomyces cyaneogriseus]|uniref:class F sortase n=1 Tax=Streptomyces cyaneogriseus TaxID=68192 RepID=UPI00099D8B9A|nr:class F sortase [Streptomyces cyaneogriseus]